MNLADAIRLACLLEATVRKPGNVHPAASFADLCYADFARSAEIIAPILAETASRSLGQAIFDAVAATQRSLGRNTNLGMTLLLAPLAAVPSNQPLALGVPQVLRRTTTEDASLVYRAIRCAQPGGMGRVDQQDLSREPTLDLIEIMRLAAHRDRIAEQYATGFRLVLQFGLPVLARWRTFPDEWETAIIELHLRLMAAAPDTLIARKCGTELAAESARRAQAVLDAGWPETAAGLRELDSLDAWLRADGHRRNPGTTADLVAACLFAALREGLVTAPRLEAERSASRRG